MTSPTLPTFIPAARRSHALTQRRRRRHARRKELFANLLLFAFFTWFFAIAVIAAFS